MKKIILAVLFVAAMLPGRIAFAAENGNVTNELHLLVTKVNADIQDGKKTETDFADDIRGFNAVLAEHKGEKTDAVARVLYMEAQLYSQVIGDTSKSDALMKQLKTDFNGTQLVADIEKQEASEADAKRIQAALVVGAQFPDFNVMDVTGKPLSIANFKGKVVLVDFWATWCPPCRAEFPNVVATYQKYHDKGFEVIGVSLDEDRTKLEDFIQSNGMAWPEYFNGLKWANKLAVKYGIESIPDNYLLDGNGKIIGSSLRGDDLSQAVAEALGNK